MSGSSLSKVIAGRAPPRTKFDTRRAQWYTALTTAYCPRAVSPFVSLATEVGSPSRQNLHSRY
jgi:hypothetical protein